MSMKYRGSDRAGGEKVLGVAREAQRVLREGGRGQVPTPSSRVHQGGPKSLLTPDAQQLKGLVSVRSLVIST